MTASPLRSGVVRRVVGLAVVLGSLGLAGLTIIERPLAGVGVYAIAMITVGATLLQTDVPVFDERDELIAAEAAGRTLMLVGIGSAVVFPALTVAWGLNLFEWHPWSAAVAVFVAALYLTYAVFTVSIRQRR